MVAIDKGGVGKSFFCVRLVEWLALHGVNFSAFDPDYSNSTLTRFYPSAKFLDIRHSENLDQIVESFDSSDLIIVDGVGAHQSIFLDWMEETDLLNVKQQLGLSVTLVLIIESDKDTVHQAGEAAKRAGNLVDWLVVKNQKMSNTMRIYDNSQARQTLLANGAIEVEMPKLQPHLAEILQGRSMTIDKAMESPEVNLLDRQRLIDFSRNWFEQLDNAKKILLP
ncbi:hypothetical protein DB345_17680 [Spartobacteria bacterium LR76]|nr:hypothetical protein DB345_17680 [Spartobacteria bacterium LR76]